jgi:outer membrane receptor protein involved in Fe transport
LVHGAALAAADTSAGGTARPEREIIVTGERVKRRLRDTPSSVYVATQSTIEAQGSHRLDDVLEQIPNVVLGARGPTIRGQDTTGVLRDLPGFLGGTRARVTVQVDGRAVTYNEFLFGVTPVWDVDQIEVFRTPQSTTQGRNSIAGAIFVHTNDPEFEWSGRGRLIAGTLDSREASFTVTGPVVKDELAFRLAGDLRRNRGDERITQVPIGADPNLDRYGLLRFKLLAEPSAIPGLKLVTSYVHSQSRIPSGLAERPFRQREGTFAPVFATRVDSVTASLTVPLAVDLELAATGSAGRAYVRRFSRPGVGETITYSRDLSFETMLDWRRGDAIQLHGGFHVLRTNLDQSIDLTALIGKGDFVDRQRSLGLFGEATLRPLPRVRMIAGLRYQQDSQDRNGAFDTTLLPVAIRFDRTFREWLPKLSVAYDLTDNSSAGVLIQRAYNPGGTTLNFDTGREDRFDAESLWTYEIFARMALPNRRLELTANLFHTDFHNAQRARFHGYALPGGPTAFWAEIDNVPEARSSGLEVAAHWRTSDRLTLDGGVGLLRTRIDGHAGTAAIADHQFERAPHLTASASIDWRVTDNVHLSAQLRHHGRYFSDDLNSAALQIGAGTIVNARIAYERGAYRLFGYARNLFDKTYPTYLFSPGSAAIVEPSQVGVGIEGRF